MQSMNFSTDRLLWIPALVVALLGCFCCCVSAEEDCYRGDADLEYDNPCAGQSGQPARLELCSRGRWLDGRCKEGVCRYCDEGEYQDTFTNCSTCLPCTTAADCPPGQVLVSECTPDENAVCGCPAPPPCPTCESCPTMTPCPSETPCPVQTECPACECPTIASVTTGPQEAINLTLIGECPADIFAGSLNGSETIRVYWKEPQAIDGAIKVQSHHPGDRFFAGNTTVVYVFKTAERVRDCSFVVTVLEDTSVPTTPQLRRDDTTENNTSESDLQVGCDFHPFWILVILMGVLIFILIVCLIHTCRKKNPPKVPIHPGPADPIVYCQAPAGDQLHQRPERNCDVRQQEYAAQGPNAAPNDYQIRGMVMDPLRQTVPPPENNNNLPANGNVGADNGSAAPSDAGSDRGLELDPTQQNTSPSGNTPNGAYGGDWRNTATTSFAGSNREYDRLDSTDQSPARDVDSMTPADDEASLDEDATDSRTPFIPPQSTSSSVPYQRNPEQLIFNETKRNSPVLEIEIHWIAAMMTRNYPNRREILYGRLNITQHDIDRIRQERVLNNSYKPLEEDIFKIVNYGWRKREDLEQEETRAHLIKQLDTFDKKLAEKYAEYINSHDDFSIMGPVEKM